MLRDVTNSDVLLSRNPGKSPKKNMQKAEQEQNDTERGKTILAKNTRVILNGIFPVSRPCNRIYNLHEKLPGLYAHMGPQQV